jgi:hypothetical protein
MAKSLVPVQIRQRIGVGYDASAQYTYSPSEELISVFTSTGVQIWSIKQQKHILNVDDVSAISWIQQKRHSLEDTICVLSNSGECTYFLFANSNRSPTGSFAQHQLVDGATLVLKYIVPDVNAKTLFLSSTNRIVAIGAEKNVYVLAINNDTVSIEFNFTLGAVTDKKVVEYSCYDATEKFIFSAHKNAPLVDVFDISTGSIVGSLDLASLNTSSFNKIKASHDAIYVSLSDIHNNIFVVEMDKFFQPVVIEAPKNEEDLYVESDSEEGAFSFVSNFLEGEESEESSSTNNEDEDVVSHRSLQSSRTTNSVLTTKSTLPTQLFETQPEEIIDHSSFLAHWYEDLTNWRPEGIPEDLNAELYESSGFRREYHVQEEEEENLSYNSESSTKMQHPIGYFAVTTVIEKPITHFVLAKKQLFITYEDCIQVHNLVTDKSQTCYAPGVPLLYYDNQDTLFLGPDGQIFMLGDKSVILNNLIMFESDKRARDMCTLNNWDQEELTVITLEMGLRNRELDVVQRALASISQNMEILVACIITKFIVETCFAKGSDFRTRIINMALRYVSGLVERRIIQDGQSEAENVLLLHSSIELVVSMIVSNDQTLVNLTHGDQLSLLTDILITLRAALMRGDDLPSFGSKPTSPVSPTTVPSVNNLLMLGMENLDSEVPDDTYDDMNETLDDDDDDYYYDDYYEAEDITDTFTDYNAELLHDTRWKTMSESEVISDALINGTISSAISYLKENGEEMTFESFKLKTYFIVYQLLLASEFNTPLKMLKNLGEQVPLHLHEIAFNTIDPALRDQLLRELQRLDALTTQDTALIDFLRVLEQQYPESKVPIGTETENILTTGNIDDLGKIHITEQQTPQSKQKKQTFMITALEWIRQWNQDTRDRIIMEKKVDAPLDTQLRYYIAHHDVTGLEQWINQVKKMENPKEMVPIVREQLQYCTPYLVSILSIPELKLDESFTAQLVSLCHTGQLFTHNDSSFHSLFLEQMKSYPHVTSIYLQAHQLWEEVQIQGMMIGPEFDMLDVALRNAEMLHIKEPSLNRVFDEKRPLMGLATLMYSHVPITTSLNAPLSSEHYLNTNTLDKVLTPFPTFHDVLKPSKKVTKFKPVEDDISLLDMLHDTHADLDIDYEKVDYGGLAYHDELDLEFYLCNGRAADAYHHIYGNSMEQLMNEPYFDEELSTGANKDNEVLYKQVRTIAITNYANEAITATCQQFLLFISTDLSIKYAEMINVETKAARKCGNKIDLLKQSPKKILPILEQTQDYQLVHEYTRIHQLPLYTTHMITLAKKSDWTGLLEEAQSNSIPRDVLVSIIRDYFPPSALCEHIYHAMNIPEEIQRTDRANILLNHLLDGVPLSEPIMAIAAPDSTTIVQRFNSYLGAYKVSSTKNGLEQTTDLIRTLCEKKECRVVIIGLLIFDGQNPLIHYLSFVENTYNDNFDMAARNMQQFIQTKETKFAIGTTSWLNDFALQFIPTLAKMLPTAYERSKLIAIVSKYYPQYQKLVQLEKNMDVFTLFPSINLFDFSIEQVVTQLKSQNRFEQARTVGSVDVTLEEANYLIQKLYTSSLWKYERERSALWIKIFSMFKQNSFDGGIYFLKIIVEHRNELPVQEILQLLQFAREWYDKEFVDLCIELLNSNQSQNFVLAVISSISQHYGGAFRHSDDIKAFLDEVIDSLLQENKLEKARKLVHNFNHKSNNLEMIEAVLDVARKKPSVTSGSLTEAILPRELYLKLKEYSPYIDEVKDIQMILDKCHLLVHGYKCKGARHYFKLVALHFKIANLLQLDYDTIMTKSGTEILKLLLVSTKYKIASNFIQLRKLQGDETASVCSMYLYQSFLDYFKSEEKRSFRTDQFIDDYFNEQRTTQFDLVKYSMDEFSEFAMMCDPTLMGDHISVMMAQPDCTLRCKIELIIRAYWCYKLASSFEGIQTLLFTIKTLVDELVELKQFPFIVKLLVSIRDYNELGYIFDVLMKHEQFELILKRDNAKTGQTQLKMVLASYLKTKFPNDNDKLMMVYLRFNMYKEYGELLMQISQKIITKICNVLTGQEQDPALSTLKDVEDQLDRVIEKFNAASDALMNEDCCLMANKCLSMAGLSQLQRNLINMGATSSFMGTQVKRHVNSYRGHIVLNMTLQEARNYVRTNVDFFQALTVAVAYNINNISDWIDVLYHQCIIMGNTDYFIVFRNQLPTNTLLFREIAKKYKNEKLANGKMNRVFIKFLSMCNDFRVQYEIARESDLSQDEIASLANFTSAILDLPTGKAQQQEEAQE